MQLPYQYSCDLWCSRACVLACRAFQARVRRKKRQRHKSARAAAAHLSDDQAATKLQAIGRGHLARKAAADVVCVGCVAHSHSTQDLERSPDPWWLHLRTRRLHAACGDLQASAPRKKRRKKRRKNSTHAVKPSESSARKPAVAAADAESAQLVDEELAAAEAASKANAALVDSELAQVEGDIQTVDMPVRKMGWHWGWVAWRWVEWQEANGQGHTAQVLTPRSYFTRASLAADSPQVLQTMIRELNTKQAAGFLTQARGTSKSNSVLRLLRDCFPTCVRVRDAEDTCTLGAAGRGKAIEVTQESGGPSNWRSHRSQGGQRHRASQGCRGRV